MARIYTHSHATVVRTTSINEANKPAIVSLPPVPLDTEEVLRVPMRERERERERGMQSDNDPPYTLIKPAKKKNHSNIIIKK